MSDSTVIASLPVGRQQQEAMTKLAKKLGVNPPQRYSGSIEGSCSQCDQLVWIGPQSQAVLGEDPSIPVVCFICLLRAMQAGHRPEDIRHLGNKEFDDG